MEEDKAEALASTNVQALTHEQWEPKGSQVHLQGEAEAVREAGRVEFVEAESSVETSYSIERIRSKRVLVITDDPDGCPK